MTSFIVVAALMTAAALVFIAVPLWRAPRDDTRQRRQSNLDVLRDQRRALDLDRQRGTLSATDYEQAVVELEQRVLEESALPPDVRVAAAPRRGVALVLLLIVPVAAALLYRAIGMPAAVDVPAQQAAQSPHVTPEQIAADVEAARRKVEGNPQDVEAWLLIARGSALLEKPAAAVTAYEKVISLAPGEPEPMLELAELVAQQQGGMTGRPTALIEQALTVAPDYWKALALAGRAAFDRQDFAAAVAHWEKLRALVPGDSTALAAVDDGLAQARARLGGAAAPAEATSAPAAGPPGSERVTGKVTLSPSLRDKAAGDDTVFIFARHASGPRMPLAVLRKKVSDLPVEFALDDSMAMSPALRLSSATSIVVTARVSKSGTVMPGSGDLQGETEPVAPGASGLSIEINQQLP